MWVKSTSSPLESFRLPGVGASLFVLYTPSTDWGQDFIAFLGTLRWGWSSFAVHRFSPGDGLLQTSKGRMLLITSKRRLLQLQGESSRTGDTPYLGGLAQTLGS